jgi:hypothetical protein
MRTRFSMHHYLTTTPNTKCRHASRHYVAHARATDRRTRAETTDNTSRRSSAYGRHRDVRIGCCGGRDTFEQCQLQCTVRSRKPQASWTASARSP